MVGSTSKAMLKTYFVNPQSLPLVVEPEAGAQSLPELKKLVARNRDFFQKQLFQVGALLFRGFHFAAIDEFENFVRHFSGRDFFNYAGGVSPRTALGTNVYTSTEYPPELSLDLHNELSYSKYYPQQLYFYCQIAPEDGGQTTLGDSRRILRRIDPKIVALFKEKHVLYERNLEAGRGSGYSWQDAFETDDKEEIEVHCQKIGADFKWRSQERLKIRQICPATGRHPQTGEEVWFNQAHGFHPSGLEINTCASESGKEVEFRLNSYFGDGTPICALMLEHIRHVLREEEIPHQWQPGDILVLDNMLTAHGRRPYSGQRKIALVMT
jgi:alpha-ketoglutarate-dependent taurine dioxygenase